MHTSGTMKTEEVAADSWVWIRRWPLSFPPKTLHFVSDKANILFLRENAEWAPPGSTAQKFTRVAIIYI